MNYKSIAIDGPAGAGKSTIAKALARELGYVYVDTGAIYRTVAYHMQLMGIGPRDIDGITRLIDDVNLSITYDGEGSQHMILNGEDVTGELRSPEMSMLASTISAHKIVRDFLLDTQRDVARHYNVIMDGRDIGTVVLPHADLKLFLTATVEERTRRRCEQLEQAGKSVDYEKIRADIIARDEQDKNRPIAPLKQARDAHLIDSTGDSPERTLEKILQLVRERL